VLDGESGGRGLVGVMPAVVAESGIVHVRVPTLNTRERVQLDNAFGAASPAP
jgi:hypothetical protein